MDSAWEALALGKDSESVGEVGDIVLVWNINGLNWLVALEKCYGQYRVYLP